MTESHVAYVAEGRTLRVGSAPTNATTAADRHGGDEPSIVKLTTDLVTLDAAVRTIAARASLDNLLHAVRVALVNPQSSQARSLMRAIGRFDGIRQPLAADPDRLDERPDVASRPPNGPAAT